MFLAFVMSADDSDAYRVWLGVRRSQRPPTLTSETRQGMLSMCGIDEPARKHGVIDADIWHAVRTAMRRVVVDEDLMMLIGPAADGALLEIGILDIEGGRPGCHPRHGAEAEVLQVPRMRR